MVKYETELTPISLYKIYFSLLALLLVVRVLLVSPRRLPFTISFSLKTWISLSLFSVLCCMVVFSSSRVRK